MIPDAFIDMSAQVIVWMLSIIPDWGGDFSVMTSTSYTIGSLVGKVNNWFPIVLLFACLALILAIQTAMLAWRFILFIWEVLPFKAT